MTIVNIEERHFLNELMSFNGIFREDVTYDNIKSQKRPGLPSFSEKITFLEKPHEGEG